MIEEENFSEETEGSLGEGTQEKATSEEEETVDWKKRHEDLEQKVSEQTQELATMQGRLIERGRQRPQFSPQDSEEKELDELYQIMNEYPDKPTEGLTKWIKEREKKIASQQQASLSPVYAQMQLLGWRQKQMMEGTNWDDLMKREKKMQEVIQKNPAILQFPNALEQAEALALGTKDINQVKKEIRKQEEQRKAHTVGTSKSRGKGKETVAQRASRFYGMKFAEPK